MVVEVLDLGGGGVEAEDGDFGAAVEADAQASNADASAGVLDHFANLVLASGVEFAEGWEDSLHEGDVDLAAVGMAG